MHNEDFSIDFDCNFDFVVAQSIFSHTNYELTVKGISSINCALSDNGIGLITFVEGTDYVGENSWVYPDCTTYSRRTIKQIFNETNTYYRRFYWHHPAQTWYAISRSLTALPNKIQNFMLLGGKTLKLEQFP